MGPQCSFGTRPGRGLRVPDAPTTPPHHADFSCGAPVERLLPLQSFRSPPPAPGGRPAGQQSDLQSVGCSPSESWSRLLRAHSAAFASAAAPLRRSEGRLGAGRRREPRQAAGSGRGQPANEVAAAAAVAVEVAGDGSSSSSPPAEPKPRKQLSFGEALCRRPVAALALVPQPAVLFAAGALAGAVGKTLTAPLDRVKLLLQTRGGLARGSLGKAAASEGVLATFVAIGRKEGLMGYWKGNLPQILRVVPYSVTQLCSYELLKRRLQDEQGKLSVSARLVAGACAGMTATLLTYPLDTLRLRLAVDPRARGLRGACRVLLQEGGSGAFYKGLGPSLLGIAPYMALELAVFDLIPEKHLPFAKGVLAAGLATTACYPLDTIRRQIQLRAGGTPQAFSAVTGDIFRQEGLAGFYRGFLPNAIKNLPNKGMRLAIFDRAKALLRESTDALREEEEAAYEAALGGAPQGAGLLHRPA